MEETFDNLTDILERGFRGFLFDTPQEILDEYFSENTLPESITREYLQVKKFRELFK